MISETGAVSMCKCNPRSKGRKKNENRWLRWKICLEVAAAPPTKIKAVKMQYQSFNTLKWVRSLVTMLWTLFVLNLSVFDISMQPKLWNLWNWCHKNFFDAERERFIALHKMPGICSVSIGEVWRRLIHCQDCPACHKTGSWRSLLLIGCAVRAGYFWLFILRSVKALRSLFGVYRLRNIDNVLLRLIAKIAFILLVTKQQAQEVGCVSSPRSRSSCLSQNFKLKKPAVDHQLCGPPASWLFKW